MLLPVTPDDMREQAVALDGFAKIIRSYADAIEQSKLQEFLCHWVTFSEKTIPGIQDFLDELEKAVKQQIRAHERGKENPYAKQKIKADKDPRQVARREKATGSNEPPPKKPTKKGA